MVPASPYAALVREPIEPSDVLARVGDPADGAALLFLGVVRNHNEGRPVRGVRYEAYEAMAVDVLTEIAAEAAALLGSERVAVVHRVGELAVGEPSVAIAASSPHRAESFAATRYVIEEIKARLPVWKEERYADGDARWLPGNDPRDGARRQGAREEPVP